MSARQNILTRIRSASSAGTSHALSRVVANQLPAEEESLVNVFMQRAQSSGASVKHLKNRADLENTLRSLAADTPLAVADPRLESMFPDLEFVHLESGVTLALADGAIAETGSLCLHSHQSSSRSLFLCEGLVVILKSTAIVAYMEDYFRKQWDETPRAVHLITGPSRTADVEQTIQVGAHGPRTLSILIY